MKLLDVLEGYRGHVVDDGGQEFEVSDFIDEWQCGAEEGDRGPEVVCLPGEDGRLSVVALDDAGRPADVFRLEVPGPDGPD